MWGCPHLVPAELTMLKSANKKAQMFCFVRFEIKRLKHGLHQISNILNVVTRIKGDVRSVNLVGRHACLTLNNKEHS